MGDLVLNPHEEALQAEYRELLRSLALLITERDTMVSDEEPILNALYLRELGGLQYQALVLRMDIKALELRKTLLQKYINQDETPDKKAIDLKLEDFYQEAEKIINSQKEELDSASDYLSDLKFLSTEESKELKHLYTTLLKVLHPDLNPTQSEEQKEVLLKVIKAYKSADLDAIRDIYLTLNPDTLLSGGPEDLKTSLEEEVERLRRRITEITVQIERMNEMFPFVYRDRLNDPVWIETEQSRTKAEIEALKTEKETLQKIVSLMEEYESRGL